MNYSKNENFNKNNEFKISGIISHITYNDIGFSKKNS